MVELVDNPILFLPANLTHQAELPELQDQKHRVSMAADRKFYQTVVMEPVCLPDENDPRAYSAENNFGLDVARHQIGLRRWLEAAQLYCRDNAPTEMKDGSRLSDHQFKIIYDEWYTAKLREHQDTDARLSAYFPSKEVRESHTVRVAAARRAVMAMHDELTVPTDGQTETTQQQPVQQMYLMV